MSIAGQQVATAVADADGRFHAPVAVPALDAGRYAVTANCGSVLTAPLDLVVATRVGSQTSTLLVLLFIVLIGVALISRSRPATKR